MRRVVAKKSLEDYSQRYLVRAGWSTSESHANLGLDFGGIGFDNKGVKYYGGHQKMYGETFGVGDVIRCCIDLDDQFVVSYYKNGTFLGAAYQIPVRSQNKAFFPHICIRNACVEVNFGSTAEMHAIAPKVGEKVPHAEGEVDLDERGRLLDLRKVHIDASQYAFINQAGGHQIEIMPKPKCESPEVVMMIGLPSSGKTTFAFRHVRSMPVL